MNDGAQTIVVTGASRGIGLDTCTHFISLGFNVIGVSRQKSDLSHDNYLSIQGDISSDKSVLAIVEKVPSTTSITALINCAGITKPSSALPDVDEFKKVFDVNLFGAYRIIYHFLPFLVKKSGSSIINIASIGGLMGFPNNPSYGASKAALINLTQNLAVDLSDTGIRVNSVSPGYFRTDMTKQSFNNPKARKLREAHTILNRFGETHELLGMLEFLVSTRSSYITGQNFIIDGGWTSKGLKI